MMMIRVVLGLIAPALLAESAFAQQCLAVRDLVGNPWSQSGDRAIQAGPAVLAQMRFLDSIIVREFGPLVRQPRGPEAIIVELPFPGPPPRYHFDLPARPGITLDSLVLLYTRGAVDTAGIGITAAYFLAYPWSPDHRVVARALISGGVAGHDDVLQLLSYLGLSLPAVRAVWSLIDEMLDEGKQVQMEVAVGLVRRICQFGYIVDYPGSTPPDVPSDVYMALREMIGHARLNWPRIMELTGCGSVAECFAGMELVLSVFGAPRG